MATFAVKELNEYSHTPEVQLQDILNIINENNNWADFNEETLPEVFATLTQKFEAVTAKLNKAENERESCV